MAVEDWVAIGAKAEQAKTGTVEMTIASFILCCCVAVDYLMDDLFYSLTRLFVVERKNTYGNLATNMVVLIVRWILQRENEVNIDDE